MERHARIFVAGHRGLAGSAIVRRLHQAGYDNLLLRTSRELDLRDEQATSSFFEAERPDYVFLAAAKVGGILANSQFPVEFLTYNLMIQNNVLSAAAKARVKKLLFLGSSCIYPRDCPQPIRESYFLNGPLESTNEAYAVAKIAGLHACWAYNRQYGTDFLCVMPTNLYGPEDNYDLESAHVLPAIIRKMHEAKVMEQSSVQLWGSGNPRREFLFSEDLADACIFLMERYHAADVGKLINVGTSVDCSIREIALEVANIVGFQGALQWDTSKPDGTPRKWLDTSQMRRLGWTARTGLSEGIAKAYRSYLETLPVGSFS